MDAPAGDVEDVLDELIDPRLRGPVLGLELGAARAVQALDEVSEVTAQLQVVLLRGAGLGRELRVLRRSLDGGRDLGAHLIGQGVHRLDTAAGWIAAATS